MSEKRPRRREIHGDAEIEEAIAGLGPADLNRLEMAARELLGGFGLDAAGRDYQDLLSEAMTRTLAGARGWRRDVDFVYHLIQTMRSIANSWRKSAARQAAAAARAAPGSPSEQSGGNPEGIAVAEREAESALIARQSVAAFEAHFADDAAASAVIAGWARGMKGPEIQAREGLSKKEFEAAVLRIRRFARQGEHDHVH